MISGLIIIVGLIIFLIMLFMLINVQNRVSFLQSQIQQLQKRLNQLTASLNTNYDAKKTDQIASESLVATKVSTAVSTPTLTTASTTANSSLSTSTSQTVELVKTPAKTITNNAVKPNTNKSTEPKNSFSYRFMQWLIKGNPVAKIAIVILFFGLSYLLKYSIDHELLSPEIRLLGSLAIGVALFGIGWKLRLKNALFALILQGGAIGTFYLTFFAAFKLYEMIPLLLAFALLIIVCASSILFAVLQKEISLAILASVGGYLAPILLSTGSGNHIALFSYYLLLSSAILIISIWQSWRILNLLGFAFTFIVAALWGYRSFQAEFYVECQLFILANMLIYGVLAVLLSVRSLKTEKLQHVIDLTLLFSVPLLGFGLQYAITKQWEFGPAIAALGFGLFYLIGAFIVLRIWQKTVKQLALYGLAIGLGFSTLAVPLALSLNWTALVWIFEGTALCWVALSQKQYRFALFAAFITLLGWLWAISALIITTLNHSAFIALYCAASIVLLINANVWHYYRQVHPITQPIKLLFLILSVITWSIWIINGNYRLFDDEYYIQHAILLCYTLAAWLWFVIGKKVNWIALRYSPIIIWVVLLLALLGNAFFDIYTYQSGFWIAVWLFAWASCYYYLYLENATLHSNNNLNSGLHISLLWLLLSWIYYEAIGMLSSLSWGFAVVEWSVLTLIASIVMLIVALLNRYKILAEKRLANNYWTIGLLPIGLFLFCQLMIGLCSNGQILYWQYIPFINLLEESAIFAMIMLTVWVHFVGQLWLESQPTNNKKAAQNIHISAVILLSALCFLWGNSVILRSLSQWLDISWSFYHLWHANIVQVSLSLVWTIIAVIFIAFAHRYHLRKIWFAGALLQAIVVIKLILVDSVELDGLWRAFAFIGVALLMLVIGYLAPLPPKLNSNTSVDKNKN